MFFSAYVRDSAFPTMYDTCTILLNVLDTNDNVPVFKDEVYYLEVPENEELSVIHTAMAMDADTGQNGRIIYSIVGKFDSSKIFTWHINWNFWLTNIANKCE